MRSPVSLLHVEIARVFYEWFLSLTSLLSSGSLLEKSNGKMFQVQLCLKFHDAYALSRETFFDS